MEGEPANLFGIHALRVQGQIAYLHVLDHALAKRTHRRPLCEMTAPLAPPHRHPTESSDVGKCARPLPLDGSCNFENIVMKSMNYREAV